MNDGSTVEYQQKSRSCGCTGCGCAALVVLALLGIALILGSVHGVNRLADFLRLAPLGEQVHAGIGNHLAEVELVSLGENGQAVSLHDLEGKVVLMTFWGTWCPPCRKEMPEIAELQKKFGSQAGFRLLAVSCGQGVEENFEELYIDTHRYLMKNDLTVPVYADPNSVTRNAVDKAVGFEGYPTAIVLDRKGVVQGIWTGYRPENAGEMERLIEKLIKEE